MSPYKTKGLHDVIVPGDEAISLQKLFVGTLDIIYLLELILFINSIGFVFISFKPHLNLIFKR